MTHWHGDFETTGLDFYSAYMNIPLCIWYHTLYCKPNTKFAIISKILVLAFDNSSYRWNDYIKRYKIEDSTMIFEIESNKYENSNLFKEEQHIVPTFRLSPFQALSPFIRITPQKNCPHSLDFKLVPVHWKNGDNFFRSDSVIRKSNVTKKHEWPRFYSTGIERFKLFRSNRKIRKS